MADLGPVSAVLIGGDVAFKGAPEEYQTALTWIKELAATAGCPDERVYVVPGNHDVDRGVILRSPATQNTQAAIARAEDAERERVFRTQIRDADTARALLSPIDAYNEFAARFNCQVFLPDRLYWKQDLDLGQGISLRVHGLTSTMLSGLDGRNDQRTALYLSPLQTVLDPVDDVVNLVLCHHPPDWLQDQDEVNDAIIGKSAIHLFGHKHRQRIVRDPNFVRFSAGAVNPDRQEPGGLPGYNLVDLQVRGHGRDRELAVEAHLRQWQSNPDLFRPVLTPDGQDVFRHSIRFPDHRPFVALAPPVIDERPITTPSAGAPLEAPPAQQEANHGEAAMGDASTRNLVFRFWNLTVSQRRDIARRLAIVEESEMGAPEPERYGRALIRASERGLLEDLAREVAQKEAANG